MILRLAYKNIIGNGWRSLMNMLILSFVLIAMIWMQAMYFSWIRIAEIQQKDWEFASGMLRIREYDPFDAFTWEKSHADIPAKMEKTIAENKAVPVLFSPATIYPEGRMMPAMLKGIPANQTLLKFPSHLFQKESAANIPILIGRAMAKSSRLQEGDIFTIRLKDISGAYNAFDAKVVRVLDIPVPAVDMGTIWMDLQDLQMQKNALHQISVMILSDPALGKNEDATFRFIDNNEYFADLYQIRETERGQEYMMYGLLIFLAMIAIFDTQALAVFKRRKEIGTLSALGLSHGKISLLFTSEGVIYLLFAVIIAAILGMPIFWYFAVYGYKIPDGYDDFGIQGFSEPIRFSYPLSMIFGTILFLFVLTAFVSWLPTRKIAKMSPTDALKGKVN